MDAKQTPDVRNDTILTRGGLVRWAVFGQQLTRERRDGLLSLMGRSIVRKAGGHRIPGMTRNLNPWQTEAARDNHRLQGTGGRTQR